MLEVTSIPYTYIYVNVLIYMSMYLSDLGRGIDKGVEDVVSAQVFLHVVPPDGSLLSLQFLDQAGHCGVATLAKQQRTRPEELLGVDVILMAAAPSSGIGLDPGVHPGQPGGR